MSEHLVLQQHLVGRLAATWPTFVDLRRSRLAETVRLGGGAERVAELIVTDLFTEALDWQRSDLNHQLERADVVLSRLGVKYLVVETKRPGALAWNRRAVETALDQATRYAVEQGVRSVAVSDGYLLYAADVVAGGHRGRAFVALDGGEPPLDLWWLSVHGIYRSADQPPTLGVLAAPQSGAPAEFDVDDDVILHPRYGLPARCFAYVGAPSHPSSWHLPYRTADGAIDPRRLPKAIQAILTNYRGEMIGSVPESAIPAVLDRLAAGAREVGHMPDQRPDTAEVYQLLSDALAQRRGRETG